MTAIATSPLSLDAVVDTVLDLLSTMLLEEVGALRARLTADGASMPIDSLDLFDVVSDFRALTGLAIPVKRLRRSTMQSVVTFANFVVEMNSSA